MARQDSVNGERNGGGAATDTLRDAGQELLGVVLKRAASSASDRVSDFSDRLTNVSESGESLRSLVRRPNGGDRDDDSDDDGEDSGSGFGSMLSGLKDKVQNVFSGSKGESGGKKKLKLTNIVETIDGHGRPWLDRSSIARMQSTERSNTSINPESTARRSLRTSSSSDSATWVNAATSANPNVAAPPLMECAARKMVCTSSWSVAPESSASSAASIASSPSRLSSKNVLWN